MKTTKAVRLSNNFVGVEINTIQDVVKAQAAGLKLVDKEGCKLLLQHDNAYTNGVDVFATKEELVESLMKE